MEQKTPHIARPQSVLTNISIFLLFLLSGLLFYSVILNSPFKTLDDYYAIVINPQIKDLKNFGEIMTTSFFGDGAYYRPLVFVNYMLEYHFFKLKTFFYNFDNVLLHILNAFAVFLILKKILRRRLVAFLAAFIFLIHPIQVEAVSNIAGRSIILCAGFFLWSFYFFLRCLETREKWVWFFFLSLSSYGLSLLSKEPAVILFLIILGYLFIFRKQLPVSKGSSRFFVLAFTIVTILYFVARRALGISSAFRWGSLKETLLGISTFFKSAILYLSNLIVPIDLYYDRSMPLLTSFSQPSFWLTVLFWGFLAFLCVKYFKKLSAMTVFFIFWFWANLLPVSQIVPIKLSADFIATSDHFLYLPSIGFFAVFVLWLEGLCARFIASGKLSMGILRFFVIGYLSFLGLTTLQHNIYSLNQLTLFERSLKHNPDNLRVRNALAIGYGLVGDYPKARKNFEQVLEKEPWDVRARIGLGKVYSDEGRYWESILQYEQYKTADLLEEIRVNNLNYSYAQLIQEYQERLKSEPQNARLHFSLGVIYSKREKIQEAIEQYEQAIALDPQLKDAHFNLASILDALDQKQKAVFLYERSLELTGGDKLSDKYAYERLAIIFKELGDPEKAIAYDRKAKNYSENDK